VLNNVLFVVLRADLSLPLTDYFSIDASLAK